MRATTVALILLSAASPAGASRISASEEVEAGMQAEWMQHEQRWCTNADAVVSCDSDSIIDVYSAFYSRAWRRKCSLGPGNGQESCNTNVTDAVLNLCEGKRECVVPASFHPSCEEEPHHSIRIVWDCVAGSPATATEDTEVVEVSDLTYAAPAKATSFQGKKQKPPAEVSDLTYAAPAKATSFQGKKQKPPVEASQDLADGKPGGTEAPVERASTTAPRVADHGAQDDEMALKEEGHGEQDDEIAFKDAEAEAEKVVEKVKHEPGFVVSFNPCYRRSRSGRIKKWFSEVFHGTLSWKFASRLTSCPKKEGCFRLAWPDERQYEDPMEMPRHNDILQASLVPGKDSWAVTFKGIGLKRSKYHHWGVCLPKTEGVDMAVATFNSLKDVGMAGSVRRRRT